MFVFNDLYKLQDDLSEFREPRPSGTEELLQLFQRQQNMKVLEENEAE